MEVWSQLYSRHWMITFLILIFLLTIVVTQKNLPSGWICTILVVNIDIVKIKG